MNNAAPPSSPPSPRKVELLEAAYEYALTHGVGDLSLRPLATAIGSSPRVLLYLFESKEGLVEALLARARADQLAMLDRLRHDRPDTDVVGAAEHVWTWLADPRRRGILVFWVEGYARSLFEPESPSRFARRTVADWLNVLAEYQPPVFRSSAAGESQRTILLAILRGALLDLLATGDASRVNAAVHEQLEQLRLAPMNPNSR